MRVVVVGAGIVGAACAFHAAAAGLDVTVLDRGPVGAGTTSRGEGNILLSDKKPGPELELARLSRELWDEAGAELGPHTVELQAKGGLVVASTPGALAELQVLAARQAAAGVRADRVGCVRDLEPHLAPGLPGGVHYPQDAQVQPVLAAAGLLGAARRRGARVRTGEAVLPVAGRGGRIGGVRTADGAVLPADAVVNAAGTWGGEVGRRLGAPVEILPRRGFVLVTQPLPPMIRHKVYSAGYVADVDSDGAGLGTSCVVEGTRAGTILIGASRERVGFDTAMDPAVVAALAAGACRLFPFLRTTQVIRTYRGFRPYCPDHLPVVGPDPRVPGVVHACGHEGAGVGLAPATGALVTAHLLGRPWRGADPAAHTGLLPDRFLTREGAPS
ncbi:NAD(P)/FAD-dependent oxidoreductase [Streptomyces sanyensis]|uniref:NAD(P)/FAD-dependent oxidoreductase n=1 Tax=Streptomyces sanyensis TaxID=568869 RepID=UPI003D77DB0F